MTVTRRKPVKDPLTGEVVGLGPKASFYGDVQSLARTANE